jgi:hypothetical protein
LHAFHSIGHATPNVVVFEGQQVFVAMAAGDAERRAAHQHMRTGHIAGVDGVAQSDVAVTLGTHVAHRGKASFQSEARVARADQG